jgi:hypothetical protein
MLDETKLEVQEGIVGNDDPDSQEDYFQNPIQQHDADVKNNDEPGSIILGTDTNDKILESLASGTNTATSRYSDNTAQYGSCHQASHNQSQTNQLVYNIAYPTE